MACLVYALLVPRFLSYSHIVVIAPAYRVLCSVPRRLSVALLVLAAVPTGNALIRAPLHYFAGYSLLAVFLAVWAVQLLRLRAGASADARLLPGRPAAAPAAGGSVASGPTVSLPEFEP